MSNLARPGHVRNVNQAFDVFLKLDKRAECNHVLDLAVVNLSDAVFFVYGCPGIWIDLFEPQRDPFVLLVDIEYLHLYAAPFGNTLRRVLDTRGPAHIRDVKQTFQAFLQFDERTITDDIFNFSFDQGPDFVVFVNHSPRIRTSLLHPQGKLPLLPVNFQYADIDFIALFEHVSRSSQTPPPGHVGNVQQAFNAFLQFDESAIIHYFLDFSVNHRPERILVVGNGPWIIRFLLQSQGNFFTFPVGGQNDHVNFLSFSQHFRRMPYVGP